MFNRFYSLYSTKWGKQIRLTPSEILHIEEIGDRENDPHYAVADYCLQTLNAKGIPHPVFIKEGYRRGLVRMDNISILVAKYKGHKFYIYKEVDYNKKIIYKISCDL